MKKKKQIKDDDLNKVSGGLAKQTARPEISKSTPKTNSSNTSDSKDDKNPMINPF